MNPIQDPIPLALLLASAFAASWALTGAVRRHALRSGMMDVPNERSSHRVPTPRGGGLGLVLVSLAGAALLALLAPEARRLGAALLGGAAVAAVGWLDDRSSLPASRRFALHGLAAVWALAWIGAPEALRLGGLELPLGVAAWPFAWLVIVWMINLYNFMDGIDGLAGGQAVVVGAFGALLSLAAGAPWLALASAGLAAASAGFLVWNRPPAKIFMGDVASGFLGYAFAVLALASSTGAAGPGAPLALWLLLLAVFVVDATATLLLRVARGERPTDPHRSHAYQRAALERGHAPVSAVCAALSGALGLAALAALRLPWLAVPLTAAGFALVAALWARWAFPAPPAPPAASRSGDPGGGGERA